MASKLIIDRIPPDMHVDEKGNITWTPRLIDFNSAIYSRGHVVTSDEFTTELIKQTYQGNYNTDTISILVGLYNDLKTDVTDKADTALSKATTAEANVITAINTANDAYNTSAEALSDVQAAVNTSINAVEAAEIATVLSEEAMAIAEDASDRADEAKLEAYEAMRIAEAADAFAVSAEDKSTQALNIAQLASTTANSANTKADNAVASINTALDNANSAKQIATEAAATVASKASTDYVDNALKEYYNKSTIDTMLENVSVDLSGYYTKTEANVIADRVLSLAIGHADTEIAKLIDSAPETLDTFKEIADAFAEDQEVLDTLNAAIGLKANQTSLDETNQTVSTMKTKLDGIEAGAEVNTVNSVNGKTGTVALSAEDVGALPSDTPLFSGNYNDLSNKPTLFNGNYNDLTNKPTIPTNNNQLTNGAGYITASRPAGAGIEFKSKDATHFMLYGNPQVSELYAQIKQTDGTNHYVKVMDLAGKLYSNNKEVAIKDDIPTDYLPLSGGTLTGVLGVKENGSGILYRSAHQDYYAGTNYRNNGNEAVCFENKNPVTSWIFRTYNPLEQNTLWNNTTPSMQIKNQRVTINKLIPSATDASYNLDVGGTANATELYQDGKQVANKEDIPTSYIKDATVSNDKLTVTKNDGATFEFEGGGGTEIIIRSYDEW